MTVPFVDAVANRDASALNVAKLCKCRRPVPSDKCDVDGMVIQLSGQSKRDTTKYPICARCSFRITTQQTDALRCSFRITNQQTDALP